MFHLPQLPYMYDALEPMIDAQTMEIHHTKHHQAYIDKLNTGLQGTEYDELTLPQLFAKMDSMDLSLAKIVKNHGG
jgi:Fe-Mn family superoxide dismutase